MNFMKLHSQLGNTCHEFITSNEPVDFEIMYKCLDDVKRSVKEIEKTIELEKIKGTYEVNP